MKSHPFNTAAHSLAQKRQSDSHSLNLATASLRNGAARGNPAMKSMIAISAAAAVLVGAGAAAAQDPAVELLANAPDMCTLPAAFGYHSSTGGAGAGQLSGNTWNIPPAQFATSTGAAVTGQEIAIRLRGTGFCNISHTITVTSARGGLTSNDAGEDEYTLPPGFADRRAIHYEAYWVANGTAGGTAALGPKADLMASSNNLTHTAFYTLGATRPPPGNRFFDLRIGMPRGAMATPLLAGDYSDTVTVTLSPQP